MQVLILGYGEMGHAMEAVLGPRHELAIWERFPADGFVSARLEDAAPAAEVVILCLPAAPHGEVLQRIAPMLRADSTCLSIAKGLDDRGRYAAQVLDSVLGGSRAFAVLYGPMIAEELQAGGWGFAQAGCPAKVYGSLEALFAGSRLRLAHTTDVIGVSWSVVLKNVYAIAFGAADGLGLGDNVRGCLMVQALRELERIVTDQGGDEATCHSLAGLGDLATTATSVDSHHHALGVRLARGETDDISGEGVHTLSMVSAHGLLDVARYPLMAVIRDMVDYPATAAAGLADFIATTRL